MHTKIGLGNKVTRRDVLKYGLYSTALGFSPILGSSGCHRKKPQNVIFILLDTLRADHLGAYGYSRDTSPFLDSFAAENIKYNFAISPAPWTAPAVASIFTSYYPSVHGVVTHSKKKDGIVNSSVLAPEFVTLAEVLQHNNFHTAGVTANAWVSSRLGFAQGFDSFQTFRYSHASKINRKAYKILSSEEFTQKPFFLYLHYMDPHRPYKHPEEHNSYTGQIMNRQYSEEALLLLNKYDGAIHYLDSKLKELFSYLKENGLYDDSIIIITSDHGEKFGEHNGFMGGHGFNLHQEDIHVPLFIKANKPKGEFNRIVSTIDIYPTILELLDIPLEGSALQGVSLFEGMREGSAAGVFSEGTKEKAIKAFVDPSGHKLIIDYDAAVDSTVTREDEGSSGVYNIIDDPKEEDPLSDDSLSQKLSADLYRLYLQSVEYRGNVNVEQKQLDQETIERLKALGYL